MTVTVEGVQNRLSLVRGRGSFAGPGAAWVLLDRDDEFRTVGESALVARGQKLDLDDDVTWTAAIRLDEADVDTRWISIDEVAVEQRGEGPTTRTVRTYVPDGPLICGETINPPGGWSSWPPHRHEHEEIYLYRFDDPEGFGVQMAYRTDPDTPKIVRDGDVEWIYGTYHPVVASPKSSMLYVWALAGESMTLTPEPDPRYA